MSKSFVITAMLEAAFPVVKSYWTDLVHDARLIEDSAPGDTFLWAPREMGSHIIVLSRGDKPNTNAAKLYEAMTPNARQWYYIELGERSIFEPIDTAADEGAKMIAQVQKRAFTPGVETIAEIHM